MCCDRPGVRAAAVAGLVALLLPLAGCGRKEPPFPPPSKRPAPLDGVDVVQRGDELVVSFPYPTLTVGGLSLPEVSGVESIEVWRAVRPLLPPAVPLLLYPEDELGLGEEPPEEVEEGSGEAVVEGDASARPPAESSEGEPSGGAATEEVAEEVAEEVWEPPVGALPVFVGRFAFLVLEVPAPAWERFAVVGRPAFVLVPEPGPPPPTMSATEVAAEGERLLTLTGEELAGATVGSRVTVTLPLEPPYPWPGELHGVAVKVLATDGRESPFSDPSLAIPAEPPPAPESLSIEPTEEAVLLAWTWPESEPDPEAFHVYRRTIDTESWGGPLAIRPGWDRDHDDERAAMGLHWVYTVVAVGRQRPTLESRIEVEESVDYQDRYPPAPPEGLVALVEATSVRLVWETGEEPDLRGWVVYRRQRGGDPEPLFEHPVQRPEWVDETVTPGEVYTYEVRAVDWTGNFSQPGEPEVVSPE